MICPNCRSPETRTSDSRPCGSIVSRKRRCVECSAEWMTTETIVDGSVEVGAHFEPLPADPYGKGWTAARAAAIARDVRCRGCLSDEGLEVHHRKPVREFTRPEDAHYLDNLVTLCRPCHRSAENAYRNAGLVIW